MIQSNCAHAQPNVRPDGQADGSHVGRQIERLLQILVDIDSALDREIEKVERREGDKDLAPLLVGTLREVHRRRREPYLQQLAELYTRTTGLSAARNAGPFLAGQ